MMFSLSNPPDVHANDRPIPEGKILIAEHGQLDGPLTEETLLETRQYVNDYGFAVTVHIWAVSAGWEPAGSCALWHNGRFRVKHIRDKFKDFDAAFGRSFSTLAEALAFYRKGG